MEYVKVNVYRSEESAIKGGISQHGSWIIQLTDEDMKALTTEEREVLASLSLRESARNLRDVARGGRSRYIDLAGLPAATNVEIVKSAILARDRCIAGLIEEEKSELEKRIVWTVNAIQERPAYAAKTEWVVKDDLSYERHFVEPKPRHDLEWNSDPRLETLIPSVQAYCDAENAKELAEARQRRDAAQAALEAETAKTNAKATEMMTILEGRLDKLELERFKEGFMPDKEALDQVRDFVFAPLESLRRFTKVERADIEHTAHDEDDEHTCGKTRGYETEVEEAGVLDSEDYGELVAIRAFVKNVLPTAQVTPQRHTITCKECKATAYTCSAKISLEWHDEKFSRLYDLVMPTK